VIEVVVSQKSYEKMKDELSSLRLTLETLSNQKVLKEIRKGLGEIQKEKWTKVRDDIKI
jgi:hypothetical protein